MVKNIRYSNGLATHVTAIRIPDTQSVQYSDESGIWVSDLQKVLISNDSVIQMVRI